uniref:Uncharacterized protein n=1 Tax=Rhizophora mucronata TaxID=61149 RepID=A0A2P2QGK0_RHIMU
MCTNQNAYYLCVKVRRGYRKFHSISTH